MVNSSPWTSLRAVLIAVVAVAVCMGLMQIRRLDPTTGEGSWFGLLFTVGWCLGLMDWSLAVVSKHSSQFGLGFLLTATAAVALFLAAGRMYPWYVPFLFTLGAFSLCMLIDGVRAPASTVEAPSLARRTFIGMIGAFGLAHVLRVAVVTMLA